MGIIYSSAKKYSMHVSSTAHLSFKGHFNNQDVPKKGKNPEIPRKAWPFYTSPCWKALKQCLAKLPSESSKLQCHAQKYFPELIKIPCKHSENMLWRKEKEAEGSLWERAKLGLDSPLSPVLHPCVWWTELPSHWRPGYDLAFLNTLRAAE